MLIVNVVDSPFPVVVAPSATPRMGESLTEFITHPSCYILQSQVQASWGSMWRTFSRRPTFCSCGYSVSVIYVKFMYILSQWSRVCSIRLEQGISWVWAKAICINCSMNGKCLIFNVWMLYEIEMSHYG